MSAVLVPDDEHAADPARDEEFLSRRMRWTRLVLYAAALFLGTAIAISYVRTQSIAACLDSPLDRRIIGRMGERSTVMFSVYYSLLLAAMYAPTEAILRVRAALLARARGIAVQERRAWLKERHLELDFLQASRPLFAILSPTLIGLVSKLIARLPELGGSG
jgi:hypothetical protein